MSPAERRQKILEVLCARRHDTCGNLAKEFQVSERTILRDVAALMCSYPIETSCGRYGGGVKISEGVYPQRKTLDSKQTDLLKRLRTQLDGEDLLILNSILFQFAPY